MSKPYSIGAFALAAASIGCSSAEFAGSTELKASPQAASAPAPEVAREDGLTIVSVSTQFTPAPRVRLPSVELFNHALYLNLTCEALQPDQGDCVDPSDGGLHYPLDSLALTLTALDESAAVLDQLTLEKLSSLDFSRIPSTREIAPGVVEYGPLSPPPFGKEGGLAVVVRYAGRQGEAEAPSFRIFVLSE
jgi:hypothetical protein